LWFLLMDLSVSQKFIHRYAKDLGVKEREVTERILSMPTDELAGEVMRLLKIDSRKEALHYAETIKEHMALTSKRRGGGNDYSPSVVYVGCDTALWQWGEDASISGCNGGDGCWGTVLGGNYLNNMNDTLYSPNINTLGSTVLFLAFNHYYNTESYDKGYVLCSSDGGATWISVAGPYSGNSGGWVAETLDISVCANSASTRVAFVFTSDGSTTYEGWYIDDVEIFEKSVLLSDQLYASSFESSDDGDLTPVSLGGTAPWERGTPTSGPGSALYGTRVWATNLAGGYNNDADEALQKGTPISLTGIYTNFVLRFYHWYDTETGYDSGWVEISTDGGSNWSKISPAYRGHDSTWALANVDLTPYAGSDILFRFRFKSDGSITYAGWYIDSVSVLGLVYGPDITLAYYDFNADDGGFVPSRYIPEPYSISNSYLEWWFDLKVEDDFGTYTARTGPSHTYPNITLLYGAQFSPPSAWSSWTTIHSLNTSTDYVGQSATPPSGFTTQMLENYATAVVCDPSVPSVEFIYDIRNGADTLRVREAFWITGSDVNSSRLWHKTTVINNSSACAQIGVRWEYDTHVDATDHPAQYQCDYFSAFSLSCGPQITRPVQVGPPIPPTFDLMRESDTDPPTGSKYHLFAVYYDGSSVAVPDFVYHTRWPNADGNSWTYTLSSDDISVGSGLDNAFVYFWEPPDCILPRDSIVYASFFGSLDTPVGEGDELGVDEMIGADDVADLSYVRVYTITGRLVYEGRGKTLRLPKGIYFVVSGGKRYKVLVR